MLASSRLGFVLCAFLLASSSASAQQVLVGSRGGVTIPGAWGYSAGPSAGVDATVQVFRLVAIEAAFEQSLHWVPTTDGYPPAFLSLGALGVQYRLDVTRVVPYASLGLELRRAQVQGADARLDFGAALGFGAVVPFGGQWFAGGEARYSTDTGGAFPVRQTYLLRIGWRSGAF